MINNISYNLTDSPTLLEMMNYRGRFQDEIERMNDDDFPFKLEKTFLKFWDSKGPVMFHQLCPLKDTVVDLQFMRAIRNVSKCKVRFVDYHLERIIPFNGNPQKDDEKEFANIVITILDNLRKEKESLLKLGFKTKFFNSNYHYQIIFPNERFKLEFERMDYENHITSVLMKDDLKINAYFSSDSFVEAIKKYLKEKYFGNFKALNNSDDAYLYLPSQLRDLIIDGNV